jgi:hypothetical protein
MRLEIKIVIKIIIIKMEEIILKRRGIFKSGTKVIKSNNNNFNNSK